MQKKSLGAAVALLLILTLGGGVDAQEATAAWGLTFDHKPLDVITIPYKDGSAKSVYYMVFTLKNSGSAEAKPLGLQFKAVVGSDPKKQKTHIALPDKVVEEFVRRIARAPDLKSIHDINAMGSLKKGQSVKGIAVFGTFDREWDKATVTVSGLESHSLQARVRKFDGAFTLAHRAYDRHNAAVMKKAGADAEFTEATAIISHEIQWVMRYHREGDEYAPQMDPILLDGQGWDIVAKPGPSIVMELEAPFKK